MPRTALAWRVALAWTLVASIFVAQNVATALGHHQPIDWLDALWYELEYWSVFLVCTPWFVLMAHRFRFEHRDWGRRALGHLAGGLSFAFVQPLAAGLLNTLTLDALTVPSDPRRALLTHTLHADYAFLVIIALWKYAVVILVCAALDYRRRFRENEIRGAQLERRFAQAQLAALRMQLQPHFLFNALHSAALLVATDPTRAKRTLVQLGAILRETLETASDAVVPLAQELEFIDRYLDIERVRFTDRLHVRYEVSEAAEQTLVPCFILQPLVENAVHHALAPHAEARTLTVRGTIDGSRLHLEVEDDGPGLAPTWTFDQRARTGLRTVQARVDLANGKSSPLEFHHCAPRGLRVRLSLDCAASTQSAA